MQPTPDDPKHGDTTTQLERLAPAAAAWPAWWRRNLTPTALYTIGAVVFAAVVTVTTVIVAHNTDRLELAELKATAARIEAAQSNMAGDIRVLQNTVGEVKSWEEKRDDEARQLLELRNPYVKSHPRLESTHKATP